MAGEDKAKHIKKRWDALKSTRGTWESHWEDVARLVFPRYEGSFTSMPSLLTKGEKKNQQIFDSTATTALGRFAAAMESMLTPRNQKWHMIRPTNTDLAKDRDVQLYFEQMNNVLFEQRYKSKANFASQMHEAYMTLGAFGTAGLFVDANAEGGLRYKSIDLGELLFDVNFQGLVDTSYRKFTQTARQIMQQEDAGRFENVPEVIRKAATEQPDRAFELIHCIMPNENYDPERVDAKSMRYSSTYMTVEGNAVVSESGYRTFRYGISRYVTGAGETYGRSPAMEALPAIKTVNEQKKTLLVQGQRVVDPILLTHDDGIIDTYSLRSGSIVAGGVSKGGQRLVQELPTGSIAAGQELLDQERVAINDAFLVNLFQILVESHTMTATEVLERAREKGALLSPTMGRQQSEMLGPIIEAEVDVLARQGLLPPAPQILVDAGGEYEVEYTSPLSRDQKAEESSGFLRTFEGVAQMVNVTQDPSPLDNFNMDVIVPALAERNAVPPSWMNSAEDIAGIREGRAQQQAQQQAVEMAPAMVGAMGAGEG